MERWIRAFAAVVLVVAAIGAHADEAGEADAGLNRVYTSLSSKLDTADRQRLRDAQRAWIAFRDKECSFRAQGGDGGSASALASTGCVSELTRQRTDALQRQLDCPEGDVTCVPRDRDAVAAPRTIAVACSASAGKAKAERYVQQCLQVSPATHPPCNVANPCELITEEIARGCGMIGKDAPTFCAGYAGNGTH